MPVLPRQSMIQCNSFQITNSIFHRTRITKKKKILKIGMETQKTLKNQSNLRRRTELEESGSLTSDYTTKL